MSKKRVVCTASIDDEAVEILSQQLTCELLPDTSVETLMNALDDTVAIVCRGEGKVPAEIIDAATDLRVIGRPGAGYDSVDVEAATRRAIPVVLAPVGGFAVAEGAVAMLLTLIKNLPQADEWVKTGQWSQRYCTPCGDLTGHTLGIVGFGRIGQHLARLVQPFDLRTVAYDTQVPADAMAELGVEKVDLETLLAQSDYVSLHVPLLAETKGLITAARLAQMKRGAILINTSRGGVVESLDVIAAALSSGQLGGVGFDVFPDEPPDHKHPLFRHERCLCAPHYIGLSTLAWSRICCTMAAGMNAVLRGEKPEFCINPQVL
ncbi:MAG: hydroxyacid dehydrogenase [Lentisphaeria bacterium]|jgi:phosphoglycerate dehydrogenase-like enzyme|nr:hydroxyacid dehydrogenase [Lentisphaeria bacterium]MDP7740148.1 hydroxyacid dehydrogenase [Lentisphaeria bacterium]